jgi:hypothetical protein
VLLPVRPVLVTANLNISLLPSIFVCTVPLATSAFVRTLEALSFIYFVTSNVLGTKGFPSLVTEYFTSVCIVSVFGDTVNPNVIGYTVSFNLSILVYNKFGN